MKILQLGNGGGLNPLQTNSAFLIDLYGDESSYLLFDCGFNIMARLIKEEEDESNSFEISKIDYVFLSHTHDDHVGNYETLTYWNYFKNNKTMETFCGSDEMMSYIKSKNNKILITGQLTSTDMFSFRKIRSYTITENNNAFIRLDVTIGEHGGVHSNGLCISSNQEMIFISGDTKACPWIEKQIYKLKDDLGITNLKAFHDYSFWDAPTRNVHTCRGDFTAEYSKRFQDECNFYHTGTEVFIKEWQDLDVSKGEQQ